MKEIFSKNLRKLRAILRLTQPKMAGSIGVTRQAYASWEEARAFPREGDLVTLAKEFGIADLVGFISNPKFDIRQQFGEAHNPGAGTAVERKYREAGIKEKLAVNILLGLVDLEEGV